MSQNNSYSFELKDEPKISIKIWPNRSLNKVGLFSFILLIWSFMLIPMIPLIGSAPFWGILPFFMITLSLLYLLLNKNYNDATLVEELSIWSDLIIVKRTEKNKPIRSWEANPYWSTVNLYKEKGPVEKYLTLKGNGREIELGSFLSPNERKSLHFELKKFL